MSRQGKFAKTYDDTVSNDSLGDVKRASEYLRELRKLIEESCWPPGLIAVYDEGLDDARVVDANMLEGYRKTVRRITVCARYSEQGLPSWLRRTLG